DARPSCAWHRSFQGVPLLRRAGRAGEPRACGLERVRDRARRAKRVPSSRYLRPAGEARSDAAWAQESDLRRAAGLALEAPARAVVSADLSAARDALDHAEAIHGRMVRRRADSAARPCAVLR